VTGPAPRSGHGAHVPRGLAGTDGAGAGSGRFAKMFPDIAVREVSTRAIEQLVARLKIHAGDVVQGTDNTEIEAGYTYFGQFVDHDLTFDPTSLRERSADRAARVNFRTPRLDLDSVYGAGPVGSPFLYESEIAADAGVKLLVDRRGDGEDAFVDLARNRQGRALIGDPRNDENLVVAQLHLLFVTFHNAVVDHIRRPGLAGPALFAEARRLVQWHYQWIVTHDHLRRIVGEPLAAETMAPGGGRRALRFHGDPFMPVEFSGAAYRFGHSMVRPGYLMNSSTPSELPILPIPDHPESLRGFRFLPRELVANWRFFFDLGKLPPELAHTAIPQPSQTIDTILSKRLFALPADIGTDGAPELALLNLLRGRRLELAAGQDIAHAIGAPVLDAVQLELVAPLPDDVIAELEGNTPLWYYVLCEASALEQGLHLGPVGGRIVADVLAGLLEADPESYVIADPSWVPELDTTTPGDFLMADLIRFAYPEYRGT